MPVKLTKTLGLKLHDSSSNGGGNGKVLGINLPEGTPLSRNRLRGMIIGVEDIGAVALQGALRSFLEVLTDSAVEDVRKFRRTVVEDGGVNTKVLREDVSGGVGNPVVDHEGCSYCMLACDSHEIVWVGIPNLFKVTVVKYKQILILIVQTLDIMSNALGEVPDISRFELLSCESPILVNSSEKEGSVVDKTPFSLALCQFHLN